AGIDPGRLRVFADLDPLVFKGRSQDREPFTRTDPLTEYPFVDVDARQRLGVLRGEHLTQPEQSAGVVAVVVAEYHLFDVGQVDTQLACIVEHGVRPVAGIEQDLAPVNFDQRSVAPFADTAT